MSRTRPVLEMNLKKQWIEYFSSNDSQTYMSSINVLVVRREFNL